MKYLKYTYVDAITGISIAAEPAMNGPKFPAVPGLEFAWARESRYPTPVPEFFGTCPDDSPTQVEGVLGVFLQADWEQMQADEMRARVPQSVTMRQARLALHAAGLLTSVDAAIAAMDEPDKTAASITWEFAQTVDRGFGMVPQLAAALGMTETQIDDLFIAAAKL